MFTETSPVGIDENAAKEMISNQNRCGANEFQLLPGHIEIWNLLSWRKNKKTVAPSVPVM